MEAPQEPTLVLEGGSRDKETVRLGRTTTLGRDPSNDIPVEEAGVSRRHAEVIETEEGYAIRDLASTNGTFVNHEQVIDTDHLLRDGDRIRLGASEMSLVFRHAAAVAAEPAPAPVEDEVEEAPAAAVPAVAEPAPTGIVPLTEEPSELEVAEAAVREVVPEGIAGLLFRFRKVLRKPAAVEAPAEPAEPEIPQAPLPLRDKLTRAFRVVQERIDLLRRRRTLTLSVEKGVVRVAVFEGNEVVAWGKADPSDRESSDEGDPTPGDGAGDVSDIGSFLEALRGRQARIVTDLPFYTPLIRNLSLPEVSRRYRSAVVETEVEGTIPFTQDEVDMKWQVLKGIEVQRVMAIAVQKRLIDEHVSHMKLAGMGPAATYSQASALGAVAGIPDAIVIHIEPGEAAVILVRDRAAQAVHRVMMLGGDQSPQEQAELLARAIEQIEAYNQTLSALGLVESLPLVLTGQVPDDGSLAEELRQITQRDVVSASHPFELPEELSGEEYATNLGLALLARRRPLVSLRRDSEDELLSLSLLSERHLPAPLPVVPGAVYLGLAILALLAVNVTSVIGELSSQQETKNAVLKLKKTDQNVYNLKRKDVAAVQDEARAVRQETLGLKGRLAELQGFMDELEVWFDRIDTLTVKQKPPGVSVSSLKPTGDSFTLAGTASTFDLAIEYSANVREAADKEGNLLFTDVYITEVIGKLATSGGGALGAGGGVSLLAALPGEGGAQAPSQSDTGGRVSFLIKATARPLAVEESAEPEG